jgi:hypothetical protein
MAEEEDLLAQLDLEWCLELPLTPVVMLEGMDLRMAMLFNRLRQLSTLPNQMAAPKPRPNLQQQYTHGLLLEHQVNASFWSLNLNNLRQHGSATRSKESIVVRMCVQTWYCTTLTYIYMVLRQTPTSSQMLEKFHQLPCPLFQNFDHAPS